MTVRFDNIAPYYDFLSRIVFGNTLLRAKKTFIDYIPSGAEVLILGGGTGNLLPPLFALRPDLHVDFVDPSSGMIKMAERRTAKKIYSRRIQFIRGTADDLPAHKMYDAVITNFLLDIFNQEHALTTAEAVTARIRPAGVWLFCDFFPPQTVLHRILLQCMFLFFRMFTHIESRRLPDYESIFASLPLTMLAERSYLKGFIKSQLYGLIAPAPL